MCIVPKGGPEILTLEISGSCDSQTIADLDRFLREAHQEALRLRTKQIVINCESLYFMNSAAIKVFATWLARIKEVSEADRYRVAVRTNRFVAWQRRSFSAIARSAPDILSLAG